ncbi:hypothetical protein [Gorillibacterium sp. sgz5001074]|uniref:hypothetical protein n=1 Tax=Gorillibacterium sp. sgz5001074 TaxID=3446695 RepID=UPI003F6724C3
MELDWPEINRIIEENSNGLTIRLGTTSMLGIEKIKFLLDEVDRFPDNQKTVVDSAKLLQNHLSDKYSLMSAKSIHILMQRFCFSNK